MRWDAQAYQALLAGNYARVAEIYEQLLETDSEVIPYYWYLGLAYLLQEQEEQAQLTWLLVMSQGSEAEVETWQRELVGILDPEASRQAEIANYRLSWLIRGHIREINPTLLDNLLHLISLEIKLNIFSIDFLDDWQVIDLLKQSDTGPVNSELLLQVITHLVKIPYPQKTDFIAVSLPHISDRQSLEKNLLLAVDEVRLNNQKDDAIKILEFCLKINPDNLYILNSLYADYASQQKSLDRAIEITQKIAQIARRDGRKDLEIYAQTLRIGTLQKKCDWLGLKAEFKGQKILLQEFIKMPNKNLGMLTQDIWLSTIAPWFYFEDNPQENRRLQNQVAEFYQTNLLSVFSPPKRRRDILPAGINSRPLKIGYIGSNFHKHPIGILSRWLISYHNQRDFQIYLYLVEQKEDQFTHDWFINKITGACNLPDDPIKVYQKIQEDEIDILVDLESLTVARVYRVMSLKPAPIQVTWLGFDASGLPAIDYYIADPHVLPDSAQSYYREKIWRLPSTYLAIDGFEIGVPTLRKENLDIPPDAIVYFSAQGGSKRHPDNIRLQMKILKAVPNSYFLIKGQGDSIKTQELFQTVAAQEGVEVNRLRFLEQDPSPEIHRANLQIADVVLDTYPYNGATTTLEVLWVGIPLVTKVGQQFAARNSYTFMVNAGINEGIAWTDGEYVGWGIKLGTEEQLRQQITWKLRQSRQTSPLWDAQQFTRDMEQAYQQMWQEKMNAEKGVQAVG